MEYLIAETTREERELHDINMSFQARYERGMDEPGGEGYSCRRG